MAEDRSSHRGSRDSEEVDADQPDRDWEDVELEHALKGLEEAVDRQGEGPMLTARFDEAFTLASDLHRQHLRKSTTVPYMSHLMSVAALVLEDGGDEDEAIAALLHDALEDRPDRITPHDIEKRFGGRVRTIVEACTDTPADYAGGEKPPWKRRKEGHLAHIRNGDAPSRVSLADKVHNARSILRDHRKEGAAVWARFSAEKGETLWYYRELANAYRSAGADGFLIEELERVVEELMARAAAES